MPQDYALQVFSQPTKVDKDVWRQWYTKQHVRSMVYYDVAKTGSIYHLVAGPERASHGEAVTFAGGDKEFLALYQTVKPDLLQSLEYTTRIRLESDVWTKAKFEKGTTCHDVGQFEAQNLQLFGAFGKAGAEESAPYIVHIEACRDNGRHLNSWVVNEHHEIVSAVQGYRRTVIYHPVDGKPSDASEGSGHSILIDEFDKLTPKAFESLQKALDDSAAELKISFEARALELIAAEGFGGQRQEPVGIPQED